MKKKTTKVTKFIEDMNEYIVNHPQFRVNTKGKSEIQIQTEIRPLIISFLEKYFSDCGYKDSVAKANKSFYWEGQEGAYGRDKSALFGTRSYPDFIITAPYLIAIEYKQSPNGSTVKHGIGQSIVHTISEEFHYVYYLFHDQSKDKRIEKSQEGVTEKMLLKRMWSEFNVFIRFV